METNVIGNIVRRDILVKKLANSNVFLSKPYEKSFTK